MAPSWLPSCLLALTAALSSAFAIPSGLFVGPGSPLYPAHVSQAPGNMQLCIYSDDHCGTNDVVECNPVWYNIVYVLPKVNGDYPHIGSYQVTVRGMSGQEQFYLFKGNDIHKNGLGSLPGLGVNTCAQLSRDSEKEVSGMAIWNGGTVHA